MKDKIFKLIDKITCPYLVIDKNNNIVYLNKYFQETFLKTYYLDFSSLSEFDCEWGKFRSISELAIINKKTSIMLLGDYLSEFIEYENNYDEIYRIYNFSKSNSKTSSILIKGNLKLKEVEVYNLNKFIDNNEAYFYQEFNHN